MSEHHDKYSIENTDYTVGQDNVQKWGLISITLFLA